MKQDKKSQILGYLEQIGEAISVPQLLKALGPEYKERTVRRWLSEFVIYGQVERTGQKRGTRYRFLSQKQNVEAQHYAFSSQSLKVIQKIRSPLINREPKTYNQKWFDDYKPNITSYLSDTIKKQLLKLGKRDRDEQPAGTYARRIYNRLLIDLSYNSSRLEGNTYSLIDTERLVKEGVAAEGKLDEEKIMILNHKEAIRHLVEGVKPLKIDSTEVCTIHYLLSDGLVENKYAGKVRDHRVKITGATYVPLENPIRLETQLKNICAKAAKIENAYEQSLFLLVHLAYLQAFIDVNKRTSRLSANIPLIVNNLVPLSFNDVNQTDYINAMIAIYELNDVHPLLELYVHSYLRTCQLYDVSAEAIGFDAVRVRYRKERRDIVRQIIKQDMHGEVQRKFIEAQAASCVPISDQAFFMEDIQEDLREIAPQRLVGLGATVEELNIWLAGERDDA